MVRIKKGRTLARDDVRRVRATLSGKVHEQLADAVQAPFFGHGDNSDG